MVDSISQTRRREAHNKYMIEEQAGEVLLFKNDYKKVKLMLPAVGMQLLISYIYMQEVTPCYRSRKETVFAMI